MARTHLCVFGATGFTGEKVVREIASQISTLHAENRGFTWSISGRRLETLNKIKDQVKQIVGAANGKDEANTEKGLLPFIVRADVTDEKSLLEMAKGTSLVLNCVGPYALWGEVVVKAVLEASETNGSPTHYADLTGEPLFIEKMVLKYRERAKTLGCTILHAAAMDSVPADIGVLYAKSVLGPNVTPTSVEMALSIQSEGPMSFNYGTYASAVNGFKTRNQLSSIRKQLYSSLPRPKPAAAERGLTGGIPKKKNVLGGLVKYDEQLQVYLLPFFFADPSVVRLSQSLLTQQEGTSFEAVQFVAWFCIPSMFIVVLLTIFLTLFAGLCNYSWGQELLLKYPRFFTMGLFTKQGPTQEQIEATSFTMTLVARGHSKEILRGASQGSKIGPDVSTTIKIRGPEPGYVATPILFVSVGRAILKDGDKVERGCLTPAAALHSTDIVKMLNEDGRVTFKKVS